MPTNTPIVRLANVDVDIDGRPVLHGISLELAGRRHLGIVGGNGSGKSTLLALIAGKRWPAPGRGRRIYDFGAGPERDAVTARQRIALLGHELQDLYVARGWNFRVRDVVLSGITHSDIPKRRRSAGDLRAAESLLARVGLGHLADRRLLSLSRGEQRHVLIARALGFAPTVLLLDEPESGLDAAARAALAETLRHAAHSTTLVVAGHREDELPDIVVDRITLVAGCLIGAARAPAAAPQGSRAAPDQAAADQAAADLAAADQAAAGQAAADQAAPEQTPTAGGDNRSRAVPLSANEGEPLIELANVSVWRGGRPVLRGIDWCLRAGEHWLITGPNGAGKSTLLRLLHAGLRPAAGGRIRWPGFGNPANVWDLRRQIALVSAELQAGYAYPTTVFDAIASGFTASIGRTRPVTGVERARVRELLTNFELDELADRPLATLSYGQRHRTLIARTLATGPDLLLLDEPWEGLDDESTTIVRERLKASMRTGTQIVCVSHVGAGGLPVNRRLELEHGGVVNAGGSDAPSGNSASGRCRVEDSRPR
jgi:molybdate transport system ATP-binding protein